MPPGGMEEEAPLPCHQAAWRRVEIRLIYANVAPLPCHSSSMPPGGMEEASSMQLHGRGGSSHSAPCSSMNTVGIC